MKKFFNSIKIAVLALCCLWTIQGSAQLQVNNAVTATDLANQIVGSGVTVSNAQILGAPNGYGIFTDGNTTNIGLTNGVLLTTGSTSQASGNAGGNDASTDVSSIYHGDADLASISSWGIQDACVLSFDFESQSNQITVQYVFSSEEYNEYVCSQFNDVFGFFVSGPNPLGGSYASQNIALVPSTNLPVSINTINNGSSGGNGSAGNCGSLANSSYFVNNNGTTIEYDGFTVILTAVVDIVPGETYNFKFAIADVSDGILDSGVFIKGSSFSVFLCQAGTLQFVSPYNGLVCSNDDMDDVVSVSTSSIADGDTYAFLLTTTAGEILAMNSTGTFDLSSYADGQYLVYGLSYDGIVSVPAVGGNISELSAANDEGCYELTSPLTVAKTECTEAPSLACPSSVSVQCLSDVPAPDASAVLVYASQCGAGNAEWVSDVPEGNACSGVIIRTYSATDDCGNIGYCTQSINYLDTEAPFLVTAQAEVTIECGQEDMIPSITVGDYCDEMVEVSHADMNIVEEGCNRSFERVYTFTDNCGNTGSFTQYVSVGDNTAPIIHGVEEVINVQCIDELPAAAEAFATDNCDENLEVLVFGAATGNTTSECVLSTAFGPGADWSFWTPSLFEAGITSSSNFHFDSNGGRFDQFGDGSAHLYGTVVNSVNANETFVLDMWFENAADWNTWSSLGRNYKDDLNCATPGQLFQDWTYYEMVNNLSVAVGGGDLNGVLLQFQHMPVNKYFGFQIGQGANNKNCGDGLSGWFYYTGFNNCEPISGHGDINVDVECEPSNEENICSTEYSYIYSTVDASGNYSSIVQTIVIEDTTAPEFAYCPESVSVQCASEVPAAATDLSGTDNCGGEVSIVALPELIEGNFPCNYVITRTWIAEDNCGNRSYCTQTVSVQDTQSPEFTFVPANLTVECSDEVPAVNGSAIDNCGEATVSYSDSFEGNSCYGVITRVFTAVDACGNESYATQYITIVDTTAPVFVEFDNTIQVECDQIESLQPLAASDNCNEVTVTFTEVHNSGGCLGVLERTFTATDLCGNSTTAVQYITIIDTTAPIINTPADQTVECDNVPAMEIPSAYDNCGQEVTVTGSEVITEGDCANSYTIVRTWVATDYCENVATSTTTITVVDTTNPTWVFVPADVTIECDQEIPAVEMAIAVDNCDDNVDVAVTEEVTAGDCPQASTITRIFRGFDNCGNEVIAVQHIYIVDTTAPVWNYETAVSELTFECDEVVAGIEPVATDNCGLINIAVAETLFVQSSCYSVGAFIYTATDECGNVSAPFYQYYYIVDTTAPVFNAYSIEIDLPCDNYEGVFVSATDNCNEVEITYNDEFVSGGCQGRIIRSYTAIDACQNVSYAQQIITLVDETAPVVVEQPADMTYECSNEGWSYAEVSFTDNCAEEISVDFNVEYTANGCLGFYTATWTAVDNCGNTTVVDQVITIVDTIDPTFTYVPENYTAECSDELVLGNAEATDDCSFATVTVTEETINGECPNTYTLVRTFTATDNCGNTSTATQEITVVDTTAPVWNYNSAVSELSFECDEVVASIQPTATDNCNAVEYMVAETLYVSGPCYTSGAFIFTAVDACGNVSAPFYQYFTIVDTTAPVVAPYEIEVDMACDQVNNNILISATDNCNEVTITFTDEYVSGGCQGRIIRDYTITDACQNTTYAQQIITLIDVVDPIAEVLPENLTIECGNEIPSFTPSWSDNCDDELELSAISGIAIDGCNQIISRSWTAVDNCGNSTTISQMITIVDTTAPEFEYVPADYTAECSSELSYEMAYAWDICDENVTVEVAEETVEGSCAGNYSIVRTFTATDACGNTSVETQTITVVDTTAPEFTFVPYGGEFSCENGITFGMATATDLCSDVTVTFEDDYSYECANTYSVVRTWTATDDCGNFTTANSYYFVYDYTAPSFDAAVSNVTVECASEIPAFAELTATDNCGTATVTRTEEVLSGDDCGNQVIEVYYTAIDDCGNVNYTSYTITVLDETAPVLSSTPASLVLACDQAIPAAEVVTAMDNCNGEVEVMYTETYIGEQPEEGSIADCDLITPALPAGNPCGYPTAWAMAMFNMPSAHRWYVVQSGELVQFANGTQHLVATLVNAYNPNAGFNVDVTFANAQDWAAWSSQNFPTGFKADCGGEGANHQDWIYSILQNGPGAELTGWGAYAGSSINLTHAPSSNYFGFQLGDGANNYNGGDNGFGGWFTYNGIFVNGTVAGTTPTTSNVNGGGDFAFELDCCPDYQVVRCWTAMDCSGNTAEYCQTISFEGSSVTPAIAVETATTTVADSKESIISVYPNPAVDQATFIFKAAESGKTMIEIYDLAGARIAMIYSNVVEAGTEYRTTYDASALATGVYMYRMTNGSTTEMGRMIINK